MSSSPGTIVADVELGEVLVCTADQSVLVAVPVDSHGPLEEAPTWVAAIGAIAACAPWEVPGLSSVVVRASEVGLVCVDAVGAVVHPVLWAHDDRSAPDAAWCRKKHDDAWWKAEVGVVPEFRHLVTKLSWLHRSAPEAWERSRFLCTFEDYLRWSLISAGVPESFTTRPGLAADFGLWGHGGYRAEVLALIDADRNWSGVLPDVGAEGSRLGTWNQVDVRL